MLSMTSQRVDMLCELDPDSLKPVKNEPRDTDFLSLMTAAFGRPKFGKPKTRNGRYRRVRGKKIIKTALLLLSLVAVMTTSCFATEESPSEYQSISAEPAL